MPKKNTGILTNIIEHIHVDIEQLDKKFTVTEVSCAGLDNKRRNERLKTLATEIRRAGKIMALVLSKDTYYVLLNEGQSLNIPDDELAIKTTRFTDVPYYFRDKLLLGALPKQILYPEGTEKQLFDGGDTYGDIYYPVEIKKRQGQTPYMIITVYVQIATDFSHRDDKGDRLRYLRPGVQTFMHQEGLKKSGKSYGNGPKYRLDPDHYILTQDINGDYVKRSLRHAKNRVDAINIKNENVGQYLRSRSGVLCLCLEHIREVYGDSMKIDLKRIPAEKHTFYKPDEIKRLYKTIWDTMRRYDMKIINTTAHKDIVKLLGDKLNEDHFNWTLSDKPENGYSNILIVPSKEECEKTKTPDPYQDIKKRYPDTVIQACTYETLVHGDNILAPAYENIIKELLLKHEMHQKQQLLLTGPPVPENMQFIYPYQAPSDNGDKKKIYHFYSLVFDNERMRFHMLNKKEIDDIALDIDKDHMVFIQGERDKDKKPFVYWPSTGHYIFFVDTDAVALPEITEMMKDMKALAENREQSVGRSVLVDFIEEHSDTAVSETIRSLLNAQPDADVFEYSHIQEIFRDNKTGRKDKKIFMDYIEKETGAKWIGSLRNKKDGYLESNLGFFENRSEGVYYAGTVGPAKQTFAAFCHLYRLVTDMESVPDEIMSLIEGVFHVRHKQTTALPFPFKHLREYANKDQMLSST